MAKKDHLKDFQQKLTQRSIFLTLINSQLSEIEAIEAMAKANIQYHHWIRLSPQRQSGFMKQESL
ncbi:MAG: hypothetical protein ACYS17_04265 [Planctomycetota bacterium]|jgi:hypothetical protein